MKIYLMGICGTAMAHMALLLKALGHTVVGSDTQFFNPIAALLKDNHIGTYNDFDPQRLKKLQPDCVIVGNVITRGNPEMEYLLNKRSFPFYSFPQFLEQFILKNRTTIVVTGTHGKTTTTALITFLLKQFCQPGFLIGGLPNNFECGTSLGEPQSPFVLEGDEYDTAFFDKRSKFFHYWPNTLIINNIEFDHADIFNDLSAIQRAFYQLTRMVPSNGHIVLNGDDPNVLALLPCNWTQLHLVGFNATNEWHIQNFSDTETGMSFDLYLRNECLFHRIRVPLCGRFNAYNVALAMVGCYVNGYTDIDIQNLNQFTGIRRRQVTLYNSDKLTVIEDFAHHPTAIRLMLETMALHYPQHHRIACLEPACNTSASTWFYQQVPTPFQQANEVWLAPRKPHLYCDKFVPPLTPMDINQVQHTLQQNGISARAFPTFEALKTYIETWMPRTPTLLCCFSNGRLSNLLTQIQYPFQKN